MESSGHSSEYALAKRLTYLKINLDTILNNVKILKGKCSDHTKVIAVVKSNAYGHGSVEVARYLENNGVENFAVATGGEGRVLREAGITSDIQVLGNACEEEIPTCFEHKLIPTAASVDYLNAWRSYWKSHACAKHVAEQEIPATGCVVIKVDSGMSRNGCQVEELPNIVQFCQENEIPIHSIMTHFAQSWDDPVFTQQQMKTFLQAVQPYRSKGVKVHVSNSGAIANGVGVDLDYIRPGISLYGQPPDTTEFGINFTRNLGLKPALCWMARPGLVRKLSKGRVIGYDQTYRCEREETVASFPLGYADGYSRLMFGNGVVTTKQGVTCPVVGRVSMDCITVSLPNEAKESRDFYVIKDDFDSANSVVALARTVNTIPYEVCTALSIRIPRLYEAGGKVFGQRD